MKNINKKSLALLISVALLLAFSVSGTVAYLVDKADEVVNTFAPTSVGTTVDEDFTNNIKSSIAVSNPEKEGVNKIPVYVRVALVGNWVDEEGNIVKPWAGLSSYNTENWTTDGNGFYYYKGELAVGKTTEDLLTNDITYTQADIPAGAHHLKIDVIQQSIQSQPPSAVQEAWGSEAAQLVK